MIPNQILDRLIAQAIRYKRWDRVGDLIFLRDTQEMQLLIWEAYRDIDKLTTTTSD